ncbi:MAG TPA: SEC-C metal-binding domain-containing protein [Phycisphaerae bacterium]|nr:SEC-C metal-binding domain-containing protein [Phycisphaerae bacterium]
MRDTFERQYDAWGVDAVLAKYRGLALAPHDGNGATIAGELAFTVERRSEEPLTDEYSVRIEISSRYPRELPQVWECGKRIPPNFHKNAKDTLCLGSTIRLRMAVGQTPTLLEFVEMCVVPYLYGYSYLQKHGRLPFDELDHGDKGILADLKKLFGVTTDEQCMGMLLQASLQKRKANRAACPCGSGRRLGACHNRMLNKLRKCCGRLTFRDEYLRMRYLVRSRAR